MNWLMNDQFYQEELYVRKQSVSNDMVMVMAIYIAPNLGYTYLQVLYIKLVDS